mmetsp:Transcript_36242/g.121392  ORF Transcript_36242/g.121392 Transcript_36242/m.121392 type:complete len:280 (+) Transcript_36242:604-1443(+)
MSGFRCCGSSPGSGRCTIFELEPVCLIASSASCLIVNSPGLPRLTGPMVLDWFISFISPSTRSSTKQKERVCFPSPYTVMSSPLMACMTKFETTRPSYGCIPGLAAGQQGQGSKVRATARPRPLPSAPRTQGCARTGDAAHSRVRPAETASAAIWCHLEAGSPIGVEDARDADVDAVLPVVVEAERLGRALALVVARAHAVAVDLCRGGRSPREKRLAGHQSVLHALPQYSSGCGDTSGSPYTSEVDAWRRRALTRLARPSMFMAPSTDVFIVLTGLYW